MRSTPKKDERYTCEEDCGIHERRRDGVPWHEEKEENTRGDAQ